MYLLEKIYSGHRRIIWMLVQQLNRTELLRTDTWSSYAPIAVFLSRRIMLLPQSGKIVELCGEIG